MVPTFSLTRRALFTRVSISSARTQAPRRSDSALSPTPDTLSPKEKRQKLFVRLSLGCVPVQETPADCEMSKGITGAPGRGRGNGGPGGTPGGRSEEDAGESPSQPTERTWLLPGASEVTVPPSRGDMFINTGGCNKTHVRDETQLRPVFTF